MECLRLLQSIILEAHVMKVKCLIGGDFNLVAHAGWRGGQFEELMCDGGLDLANDPDYMEFSNAWTFRSCLGTKRILDYCLVTCGVKVKASNAIDDLNLGSDHRAVQCCVSLPMNDGGK